MGVKSTTARGLEFEAEVASFFRHAGFEVIHNPRAAKPRQSDLFVRSEDGTDILIEVKNQKRKINVNEIDSFRARLNRTPTTVVGAFFTTSELTDGAVEAIKTDRRREIIVFVGEELDALRAGSQNVRSLIERKRTAIRVHGEVWFGSGQDPEYESVRLPTGAIDFRVGEVANAYFECKSGIAAAFYALALPDPGWGSIAGEGARLRIDLALSSTKDLRNLFGYIHDKFGLSRNGTFSIQQTQCCWNGVGAEEFVDALGKWPERYAKSSSTKFHHSEECRYFDEFRDGWLEISAQQRVGLSRAEGSMLHNSELVIQLPGIPIDSVPFLKLCRYVGNQWANFQYLGRRISFTRRLKKYLRLKVVGNAINKYDYDGTDASPVVVGVLARNPFYGKRSLPAEWDELEFPAPELTETELLLCSLRDWHDDGDVVDYYELQGVEVTLGGAGNVIKPFGTWNEMLRREKSR